MAGHLPDPDRDRRHLREFIKNPACTVTRSECADTVDGFCVSQQVTYSCERKKEGNGQICGGEFFCKDGSCACRRRQEPATCSVRPSRRSRQWPPLARMWPRSMVWTSAPLPAKRSTARRWRWASITVARTPAGARMWACRAAAARKRRSAKRRIKS